jgi:hypothetical protein
MAIISILSAKTAPGATTTASALAVAWPAPVLLVGADPAGDDIIGGYLGPWIARNWVHPTKGLVSFATATRHTEPGQPVDLAAHTQLLPGGYNARVLLGLADPAQNTAVGPAGWQRLAEALTAAAAGPGSGSDAILDCGRFGPATPRVLLEVADLVLVAVRPLRRSVLATRPLVRLLSQLIAPDRVGLALVAATEPQAAEVAEVLGLPVGVRMPRDEVCAQALSDGTAALPRKSPLLQAALATGTRLHHTLNHTVPLQQRPLIGAPA